LLILRSLGDQISGMVESGVRGMIIIVVVITSALIRGLGDGVSTHFEVLLLRHMNRRVEDAHYHREHDEHKNEGSRLHLGRAKGMGHG
jgi:hypothetical protein